MGLDDRPIRFDPTTNAPAVSRTDFASQILGGTPDEDDLNPDDARIHRIAVEVAGALFPTGPPTWRKEDPAGWDYARYAMKDLFNLPRVGDIDQRTEWAAQKYFDEFKSWPSGSELVDYAPYLKTVNLYASGAAVMPSAFGIHYPDGTTQWVRNDSLEWKPISDKAAWFESGGDLVQNMMTAGFKAPSWSEEQLSALLQSQSPIRQPSGGGGGGGAGRAPAVFDRAQLSEGATNRWRAMLLEEPDETTLDSLVSDYISEANAFWMQDGGSLDYDTFVLNRIRAQDRHGYLYDKKPEFQSEAEYMTGFRQTVGRFGFNDRAALRETEAGAHSGVGLAGFGERVGRTAEARLANTGSYSQRFAASMAQSGLGRT